MSEKLTRIKGKPDMAQLIARALEAEFEVKRTYVVKRDRDGNEIRVFMEIERP